MRNPKKSDGAAGFATDWIELSDEKGQIADQIPTVHHWPASDRVPVDNSLPRHAFDIRRGARWRIGRRLDDLLERCILRPISRLLMGCLDVLEWWLRAR